MTQAVFWKTHPNKNEFSSIGLPGASVIEISKKYWISFPKIGPCHTPENLNFGKVSECVFQDLPIRVKYGNQKLAEEGRSFR